MEPYERQYVDLLLAAAAERLAERAIYHFGGVDQARAGLPGDARLVADFVDAVFAEHLLDTTAGACAVLQALERRNLSTGSELGEGDRRVGDVLARLARQVFAAVLLVKADEALSSPFRDPSAAARPEALA